LAHSPWHCSVERKLTVGLDVGSGLIKVAVVDHSKREPELVRASISPLIADAIVDGEVMDPSMSTEAIQRALSSAGVKGAAVATSVGGRDVIIRKFKSSASRSSKRAS
jgi:type IV pilus assembly protein PilM